MTKTMKYRDGDRIIEATIKTSPAIVRFEDILEATEVVPEDIGMRPPWEELDGWDHEFIPLTRIDADYDKLKEAYGCIYNESERCYGILKILGKAGLPTWQDYHKKGASKQRAHELEAQTYRKNLDSIIKWYTDGWTYSGVRCTFMGYRDSCWGFLDIDDDSKYRTEAINEIANQVAHQMEADGYTVVREPVKPNKNWKHDRKWYNEVFGINSQNLTTL